MNLSPYRIATATLVTTMTITVFMAITAVVTAIPMALVVGIGSAVGYDLNTAMFVTTLLFTGMMSGWMLPIAWKAAVRAEHREQDAKNTPLLPLGDFDSDKDIQDS